MQFAAAWGLVFQCDPLAVLRADVDDLAVLNEVLTAAAERKRQAIEEAKSGG